MWRSLLRPTFLLAAALVLSAGDCYIPDSRGMRTSHWDEQRGRFVPSCFTAETRILMADGSERAIARVRPGDRVRGRDGVVNTVVGIETPRLGGRMLYGFDGGVAFFTAEHPFLTPEGWQAIDPAATARENPDLAVGQLAVGDTVVLASPESALTSGALGARVIPVALGGSDPAEIAIRAIRARSADPDETVYNLLLDGDHTYIANGFVVHNKG